MKRRDFLRNAALAGLAATTGLNAESAAAESASTPHQRPTAPGMKYRELGKTGEKVSCIGLGGYHIGIQSTQQESTRIIRSAIDRGITFMDNCWDYNGGRSETRMGQALRDGYREKVFLMTKIDGRDRKTAEQQIDESLSRLQTDRIDLLQFHEIIRFSDPDRVFAPGGAIEAVLAARKAGKIRYIGFTGHKNPRIHLRMFQVADQHHFHFDTVQMPINVMDAHYRSFQHHVIPVALQHGTAVLAMKTFGGSIILNSHTVKPIEALHYSLSLPVSVVITGIDSMPILDQAVEAARTFKPMSESEKAALLARTAKAAKDGQYERFKTTTNFDGTAHNPRWLG